MKVVFRDEAIRQLEMLPVNAQRMIVDGIRKYLGGADPLQTTRNKFRLRRESPHADFELRISEWRVFYRVKDKVLIGLIGEKRRNKLIVGGREFRL